MYLTALLAARFCPVDPCRYLNRKIHAAAQGAFANAKEIPLKLALPFMISSISSWITEELYIRNITKIEKEGNVSILGNTLCCLLSSIVHKYEIGPCPAGWQQISDKQFENSTSYLVPSAQAPLHSTSLRKQYSKIQSNTLEYGEIQQDTASKCQIQHMHSTWSKSKQLLGGSSRVW